MTSNEKLKLSRALGLVDHLINNAEIEQKIYRAAASDEDAFTRGLGRGKVESAEHTLQTALRLRTMLDDLVEEANENV